MCVGGGGGGLLISYKPEKNSEEASHRTNYFVDSIQNW